jgi:hypothetical protein
MGEMKQELRRIQEEKADLERKRLEEERARQQRLEKVGIKFKLVFNLNE